MIVPRMMLRPNSHPDKLPSPIVYGTFIVSSPPCVKHSPITRDDNHILIRIDSSTRVVIDSQLLFHTAVKMIWTSMLAMTMIKNLAKEDEIDSLLKYTVGVELEIAWNLNCEAQPLKWVPAIKSSPSYDPCTRNRARLPSALHRTELLQFVQGDSTTVEM